MSVYRARAATPDADARARSCQLMACFGFRAVAVAETHTRRGGRRRDVVILERLLPENQPE